MSKKIILITGCSTGIGNEAALALSKRGHRVIASCRKEQDVNKLVAQGLETVRIDVNDEASIASGFAEFCEKTSGRIDVLINNAGYGQAGALEDLPRHALRAQFETNVFGLMDLTRLVIPLMRQQGHGRIINISSILGIISLPFRGAYNASKYAVEGLTDTLRLELQPAGIEVIAIEPGPIESQFRSSSVDNSLKQIDIERSYFKVQYQHMLTFYREQKSDSMFTKTPEAVISKLIHAIEAAKPRPKYPVTLPAHSLIWLKRLLSAKMLNRLLAYLSKKEMN